MLLKEIKELLFPTQEVVIIGNRLMYRETVKYIPEEFLLLKVDAIRFNLGENNKIIVLIGVMEEETKKARE